MRLASAAWLACAAAAACSAEPETAPLQPFVSADRPSDLAEDPRYFTEFGRTLLAQCERIAIGEVRASSPIPGGPAVTRLEVERELLATDAPLPMGARVVAVIGTPGMLDPADSRVLVFLAKPERGGGVRRLLACSRASSPQFDDLVALVEQTIAISREPTAEDRARATRAMWLRHLEQDRAFLRAEALREIGKRLARPDPLLTLEDAAALDRIAAATRDRRYAEQLRGLAARVRARRSLDAAPR